MRQMIREVELLLGLSRQDIALSLDRVTELTANDTGDFDWALFLHQATQHRVGPLIASNMNQLGRKNVTLFDGPVWEALNATYHYHTAQSKLLLADLDEILEVAAAHSVKVIVRKGGHLARSIYKEPGLRPMGDVDIMVCTEEATELVAALERIGYRLGKPQGREIAELSRREKVFWQLYGSDLPMMVKQYDRWLKPVVSVDINISLFLPASEYSVPTTELLDRAVLDCAKDAPYLVLSAEDVVIDLCANIYKNSTVLRFMQRGKHRRLLKYVDVAEYLTASAGKFSWPVFTRRVEEYGIQAPTFYSLAHLDLLFPGTVPIDVLAGLRAAVPQPEKFLQEYGHSDLPEPLCWDTDFLTRYFDRHADRMIPASRSMV
jgi:hypothetical protein